MDELLYRDAMVHALRRLNDIPHDYANTDFKLIEKALVDLGVDMGTTEGFPPHLRSRIGELIKEREAE